MRVGALSSRKEKQLAVVERKRARRVDELPTWPATSKGGIPDGKSLQNVTWFCEDHEVQVKFNEFDERTYVYGADSAGGIAWRELDDAVIRMVKFRMHEMGCIVTTGTVEDGLRYLGEQSKFHPVREYLHSLEWDGTARLDKLLTHYLRAEDTALNRAMGKAWMVSAVRRVRQPGCKVDGVLTLQSGQGTGKSSFFRTLATPHSNNWFNDSLELGSNAKEVIENASGSWIVELAELSNKREAEEVKKFISIEADRARTAYGRVARQVPRQFVLGATVNRPDFLFDDTGNRRFWVVEVGETRLKALTINRDQLWAEAAYLEAKGFEHNIPKELWPDAERMTEKHGVDDPVADAAATELGKLPQKNTAITAADLFTAIGVIDVTKRRGPVGRSVASGAQRAGWSKKVKRLPGFAGGMRCYVSKDATDRPAVYQFKNEMWKASSAKWL